MSQKKIRIYNKAIAIRLSKEENDYISLTDIARFKDRETTGVIIANWLSTKYTIQLIGAWEQLHNPDFNVIEFHNIKNEAGSNGFILSSSRWVKLTRAIGIRSTVGRHGGTFAHKDIAFEFASWISPEFKLYLIKEFQRLKVEENERLALGWDSKRMLTKINYRIHTDTIHKHLIVPHRLTTKETATVYANEADILNMALFGLTAQAWKAKNINEPGNMRDYADVYQLVCLANLESLNAEFIKMGLSQADRLIKLNQTAIDQMQSLTTNPTVKGLLK